MPRIQSDKPSIAPVRVSPRKKQRDSSTVNYAGQDQETPATDPETIGSKLYTEPSLAKNSVASVSKRGQKRNAVEIEANSSPRPDKTPRVSKETNPESKGAVSHEAHIDSQHVEQANEDITTDHPTIDKSVAKGTPKRKTKAEKQEEAMPLATRTLGLNMYVGAHVSMAKGVENAVTNALHIGGNAFALFLKSQRKWENPPLKDENRDAFRKACAEHHYNAMAHVVPHGSYLVNLATPDRDKSKQAYDAFVDDLRRCEALGIKYYNFHPGSTNKEPLAEAITRLSENLNRALSETSTVVPLLENMAAGGTVIGSRFTDLRDIIAGINPEFRTRIGVCLDTCHAFAAGYDLRTPAGFKKTFQELDDTVGLQYLKALHINDSKAPFNSKRDLHQNIGLGFLGLRAFHNVMNEPRLQNIPLVLETPCNRPDPSDSTGKKTIDDKSVWAREIKLLESLIGMDPESDHFKALEQDLSGQGRAEREKMQVSISTKEEKARKKLEKGQKDISDLFGAKSDKNK